MLSERFTQFGFSNNKITEAAQCENSETDHNWKFIQTITTTKHNSLRIVLN
jgi:hypothetical protein